jgi:rSAM/selenodomain-associated transferase 1
MIYKYPNTVLMIFCKAPIPGEVKTRLIGQLTAAQAAELHIELSTRVLALASDSCLCPVELWCSPMVDHPFFSEAVTNYGVKLQQQQGADLGERMHRAFCCALAQFRHAVLIGCDCPSLTYADLEAAIMALQNDNDVVLAPAEDGGYVLIGLNQPHSELFENVSWGSAEVFEQTLKLINKNVLIYCQIAEQWDVDTPTDLARYRLHHLSQGKGTKISDDRVN